MSFIVGNLLYFKLNVKNDQVISLKPNQIQLMNQLELNRNQLNKEQLQMLTYLKTQYTIMQQQHGNQNPQQNNFSNQFVNQSQQSNKSNIHNQQQSSLLDSITLNGLDQLPKDLENVQPITMMHDDNSMLQDLNMLLSSHDIVEDLRISDDDKGSLDHIFSFTSNPFNNQLHKSEAHALDQNEDSNSSDTSTTTTFIEKIKLDASLTNGDTGINAKSKETNINNENNQTSQLANATTILPMNDDELLASKLNIHMTAEEILNECKSYGVNGIQTNSLLKAGRLRKLYRYGSKVNRYVNYMRGFI